jgi:hypothetical protein
MKGCEFHGISVVARSGRPSLIGQGAPPIREACWRAPSYDVDGQQSRAMDLPHPVKSVFDPTCGNPEAWAETLSVR